MKTALKVSVEQYSGFGEVNNMRSLVQETYLTMDTEVSGHDINFGIGHGWTAGSDGLDIEGDIQPAVLIGSSSYWQGHLI